MPRAPGKMRLTADHVRRVHREMPDPGPQSVPGHRLATDEDYATIVSDIIGSRPDGPFWLFGYGSLIWKPETAFIESRQAVVRGWHRRFCLGPDIRWRGNREAPGIMLALDRGGQCRGMLYRLPEETLEGELHKLIRREVSMVPSAFPWRWITVVTTEGKVTALTFAMDRNSIRYVRGASDEDLAEMLATAVGFRGSMAEYLFSTVAKLEELGIHDHYLWQLQEMVAERIEARHGASG